MSKLDEYRNKIDVIDDQITTLYKQRMDLVRQVVEAKKENNVPTLVPDRERSIINRVTKKVEEPLKIYTKRLFETIFETSKSYQTKFSNNVAASLN